MANVLTTYPSLKKHHFYKRMKSDLKTVPKIELLKLCFFISVHKHDVLPLFASATSISG